GGWLEGIPPARRDHYQRSPELPQRRSLTPLEKEGRLESPHSAVKTPLSASRPLGGARAAVRHAVEAVALSIGFYLLAVAIAAGLVALPFLEYHFFGRVEIRLIIFGVGTGVLILRSMLPQREKFVPPGPRLKVTDQPRLFDLVSSIASDAHQ